MTPGAVLDVELRRIDGAAGWLTAMTIKRTISRSMLRAAIDQIEDACKALRLLL